MNLDDILAEVNGRRRRRLLSVESITIAAAELQPGEHAFIHGGHVANSYGYRAIATGAVVWIPAGAERARCVVREVSATKGATGFGRFQGWAPSKADLAAAVDV